jgi:FkbM family methyltransferase
MIVKHFDLGLRALFAYRPDTSDAEIIRGVLIDRTEYRLFSDCHPKVIFDVGAHIGASTVLLANSYPEAEIYSFEPEPSNFNLLRDNTKSYENVHVYPIALGAVTEKRVLMASDNPLNTGGGSFHELGSNVKETKVVDVVNVRSFMESVGLRSVDLLKVDTEGSEFEILTAFPKLPKFIMGEAHGNKDWQMFDFLSETHDISVQKPLFTRCFLFYARA